MDILDADRSTNQYSQILADMELIRHSKFRQLGSASKNAFSKL